MRSALRESNPPRQLGRLAPLPLGQGHNKAEAGGSRTPKRVNARPLSRRLPSPVGLCFHVRAAVAGIEPAKGRLTAACLYQHRPHRNRRVSVVGFEPTLSSSQNWRNSRLSHTLLQEHPAGVEPALPPWQGSRLPLHHGCKRTCRIVKDQTRQSTGPRLRCPDSNPRCRITGAESWPLDHQCIVLSVGPDNAAVVPASNPHSPG